MGAARLLGRLSRGWVVVGLLLLPPAAALAAPDGGGARSDFDDAMELVGRDDAGAAARLEAIADRDPRGEFAADALLEAAQLAEEKLGRPDRARDLYARLLERAPDSRLALRARARLQFLDENLRTGVAPLAEYQRILHGYASRPPSESEAMMEALVAAHPDFVLAPRARMWLAGLAAREGHQGEAERRYLEVERGTSDGETWALARKGRADAALAGGHPLAARALFRSLLDGGGGPQARRIPQEIVAAARDGAATATVALARLVLFGLSLVYVAAFLGVMFVAARPITWRALPLELRFYLPVAALFVGVALTESRAIAMAIGMIAVGGALIVHASGLASARRRFSMVSRLAYALATALAVVALTYAAVHQAHLVDFVIETLVNGPDR